MAWPVAGRKQQHVDADIFAVAGIARGERLGGSRHAFQAALVDRQIAFCRSGAPFDLDERDRPPAPRDQIDLADRHPQPLADDPPAMKPQPPRGEELATVSAPLGHDAPPGHLASSSSARA